MTQTLYRVAPGVVLSEQALQVGLAPLFAAHDVELRQRDEQRIALRRATARARRNARTAGVAS